MYNNLKKNYLGYIIIVCGLLGVYAAFTLLLNRIGYYKDPNFIPPCSVNVWLDCGIVMKSKWSELFGFPNTIIGLTTYPLSVFTGLIILLNNKNNKWLMNGCLALAGSGMIINIILLYISAYLIGSLCPWCILAGVATSNIFFCVAQYCIANDHITIGNNELTKARIRGGWNVAIVVAYYLSIFLFVYIAFYLRMYNIDTSKFIDPIFWLHGK
jgi:uncharacterized membrane protein